jgi:hypothetical protein
MLDWSAELGSIVANSFPACIIDTDKRKGACKAPYYSYEFLKLGGSDFAIHFTVSG